MMAQSRVVRKPLSFCSDGEWYTLVSKMLKLRPDGRKENGKREAQGFCGSKNRQNRRGGSDRNDLRMLPGVFVVTPPTVLVP
jgi:hypothetical protein